MPAFGSVISRFGYRGLNRSLSQRLLTQGVSALLGLGTLLSGTPASFADIVPDGSTPSIINLGINTDCSLLCGINGGYQQGDNLFHSFSEFIIPPGGSALLSTPIPLIPSDVERIFIRVVGATTEIDGSFSVGNLLFRNSPDVIFLSPQGIRIGQEARLSYSGNFLFSTAERLDFGNGAIFDATSDAPLLTLSNFGNLPDTLQLGDSTGAISFSNNSSTVRENIEIPQIQHQFSVIGGSVNFENVEISTPGNLYVASANSNQAIGLTFQNTGIEFDINPVTGSETIALINSSLATTSRPTIDNAGSIDVVGHNLRLSQNSQIRTSTNHQGGHISLNLTGLFELNTTSEIRSTLSASTGAAGNISISANDVILEQGSLFSETGDPGGNIDVNATHVMQFDQSQIRLTSSTGAGHTGNLSLTSQANVPATGILLIDTEITNEANNTGGNVSLTAQGEVELRDGSFISINSSGADGNFTVAASAFRSNEIGADNDVLLNSGTLNNLSLPAEVTGFDLSASQVARGNGNSELLPNSFPAPEIEPPPVEVLPGTPPSVTNPPLDSPTTTPVNPPGNLPGNLPGNPPAGPETNGNDPTVPGENSSEQESSDFVAQPMNLTMLESLWQFYGDAPASDEPIPWSCSTAGESRLRISGRGGISSSPSSLTGNSSALADLGSFDGDVTSPPLASSSPSFASLPSAISSNWLEAKAWQRDEQGQIKLVAQADLLLAQPKMQGCQSLR